MIMAKTSRFCQYLIVFLIIICLSSCKKKESVYTIPEEFRAWSVFQPGSYWFYLNEQTQSIDSSYITGFSDQMRGVANDPHNIWYWENVNIDFTGSFLSHFEIMSTSNNFASLYVNYRSGSSMALQLAYFNNYGLVHRETHLMGVVKVFSEFNVNGNTFTNVYQTRDSWSSGNGYADTVDFYFAKNIGIIKLEKHLAQTDTTWSVIRWHVVQ